MEKPLACRRGSRQVNGASAWDLGSQEYDLVCWYRSHLKKFAVPKEYFWLVVSPSQIREPVPNDQFDSLWILSSYIQQRLIRMKSYGWNSASRLDVLHIALEEHLYAFVDRTRELASPATTAWRFGIAHVTFDLADIQHISVAACCDMTTPDWPSDLELATCHAGCNLTGDVGGFSIAERLA